MTSPLLLLLPVLLLCSCLLTANAWLPNFPAPSRLRRAAAASLLLGTFSFATVESAMGVSKPEGPALVYKSGKNPRPNPSDPKAGSKKDSTFLKCLSSCKQDCQRPSAGLAKGDCVQDCQDQCCASYEQCSFKIKASTGNEI